MVLDAIVRVSRVGYREDTLDSDRQQESDVRQWASAHGHKIRHVHIEKDVSGKTTNRPALNAAKEAALSGETDGVIAAYLTRFTRHTGEGLQLVQDLIDAGKRFIPLDLDVDPTTPNGEFILSVMLSNAWREWRERQAGFNSARKRAIGLKIHLTESFGYRKIHGKPLVPCPIESPWVPRIYERRANGASYAQIVAWLDAEGVRPHAWSSKRRDGNPTKRKQGQHWNPARVKALIEKRVYLGEAYSGENVTEHAHPALVSRELWERANALRDLRPRRGKAAYALSGIIRSELTGKNLVGNTTTAKSGKTYRYYCERVGLDGIKGKIKAETVEAIVAREFERRIGEIRLYAKERTGNLDAALAHLEDMRALEDMAARDLKLKLRNARAYDAAIDEAAKLVEQARATVQDERAGVTGISITDDELANLDELPVDVRRRLFAEAFDAIILSADRSTVTVIGRGEEAADGERVVGSVLSLVERDPTRPAVTAL